MRWDGRDGHSPSGEVAEACNVITIYSPELNDGTVCHVLQHCGMHHLRRAKGAAFNWRPHKIIAVAKLLSWQNVLHWDWTTAERHVVRRSLGLECVGNRAAAAAARQGWFALQSILRKVDAAVFFSYPPSFQYFSRNLYSLLLLLSRAFLQLGASAHSRDRVK